MAERIIVFDRRQNIEEPVHAACATDPQRYEFRQAINDEQDQWAKSCAVCGEPLR